MKVMLSVVAICFGLSGTTFAASSLRCRHSSTFGADLDQSGLTKMDFKGNLRITKYTNDHEPASTFLVREFHLDVENGQQSFCHINPSDQRLVDCLSKLDFLKDAGKATISWVDRFGKRTTVDGSVEVRLRTTRRLETSGRGVTEDSFDILAYFAVDNTLYEIKDSGYFSNDECTSSN